MEFAFVRGFVNAGVAVCPLGHKHRDARASRPTGAAGLSAIPSDWYANAPCCPPPGALDLLHSQRACPLACSPPVTP